MVLGTILYEGIDLSYHVLKLGYNGASSVYGYFWGGKTEMTPEEMQKTIEDLQEKLKSAIARGDDLFEKNNVLANLHHHY